MKTRRDFLRTAAGTLAGLGTMGLVAPYVANGASLGSERKFGSVMVELLYNLKDTINWKDANAAMKMIAGAARPVVNKEIDRILAEKLPFAPPFILLGDKEEKVTIYGERNEYGIQKYTYAMPAHGYLPQRYTSVDFNAYKTGHWVDIFIEHINNERYDIIARSLDLYVNGITNKIYFDVMSTLLAAAYYRNIIHTSSVNNICDLVHRMSCLGGGDGVNGMTDLFVDDDTYDKIFGTLETPCTDKSKRMDFHVHKMPELNKDGEFYQTLVCPVDKGGFGMIMPPYTTHLMFGLNRNKSSNMVLHKTKVQLYSRDNIRAEKQVYEFYGWYSMICGTTNNDFVVLGATS